MIYENIELDNAKDRDMLIMSNLSDVQMLLSLGRQKEAKERIDAIKIMLIKTKTLLQPSSLD